MDTSWEKALYTYQKQNFLVITRENVLDTKVISTIDPLIKPQIVQIFLQYLSQFNIPIWEAFFLGIKSADVTLQEKDVFSPLRDLLIQSYQYSYSLWRTFCLEIS